MPKITAQADVFRDWEAVLGACVQNAGLLPGVDPLKGELESLLAQARDLKVQQETLEGQRQGLTQRLMKVIEDGRESARKVRAYAVIKLGTDNKALSQFGVAVRSRRGGRKLKAPGTPSPTVGVAETPAQNKTESNQGKEGTHA